MKKIHLFWKALDDNIRRLQIDYFLVKKKYRDQIKSSHSYSVFKIASDYSLVMVKCEIKFKKRISKDAITSEEFRRELEKKNEEPTDDQWIKDKNNVGK